MSENTTHLLSVKDLHTSFTTDHGDVQAVNGVSFNLDAGKVLGIVGESGSGKSVTAYSIMQILADTGRIVEGQILYKGEDITKWSAKQMSAFRGKCCSIVFQDPMTGTAANMQIEENLALAARRGSSRGLRWEVTKKEREEYRALLTSLDLGLEDRLTAKVGLLSGGQRQALTLVMATLVKPKLLLLDEHTAALDPKTAAKVLEITDKVIEENNLTAIMVTHNMNDAIKHGNRLIMMNDGKIIFDVSGEEKKNLTVEDLLRKFSENSGEAFADDRAILG